jgi:predicted O-methyltransferase YrrM
MACSILLIFARFVPLMKKLGLIFPFFGILFSKPSIIFKALFHAVNNEKRKRHVLKTYNLPTGLKGIDLLDLFPGFEEKVDHYTFLYGTSTPIDMAVLRKLARSMPDCDYMEIGSWRGESLANVAPYAKHCVSVSLSDDEMRAMKFPERMVKMQRMFSEKFPNVEHIGANSRTFDFKSLNRKFDLIFIDGDHSYDGVKIDTATAFSLLKDENSVIVWHDYAPSYEHLDWEVFSGIMDGAPADKRDRIYRLTNTLCAIYTNKKFPNTPLDFPTWPDKMFTLDIKAEKIPKA